MNSQLDPSKSATSREARRVGETLRRARTYHELSIREVERRIGKSTAYLSQVERGLIKQPDPVVLLDLAELYKINFDLLAEWAHWVSPDEGDVPDNSRDSMSVLAKQIMELRDDERTKVIQFVEEILRLRRK